MENSAPSLKMFFPDALICKIVEIKIGGKTRFENLLKQLFHSPLLDIKWSQPTRATRSLVILSLHIQLGLME